MNLFFKIQKVAIQPSPNAKPEMIGCTNIFAIILFIFYKLGSASLGAFISFIFNYESILIINNLNTTNFKMLTLLLRTSCFRYFKPKIVNLSSLMNKRQVIAKKTISDSINLNINKKAQQTGENKNNEGTNDVMQAKEIKSMISKQKKNLSKQQLTINHLIKTQTKFSALHYYYKNNYKSFSHQNIVNIIIKILQLRVINKRQESQSQKFNSMIQHASRNIQKAPPEEMIRFLYMLKKIKLKAQEYMWIDPFVRAILKQFQSFGIEYKNGKKQKYAQLFDLISIDTSIKLIHSLHIIHQLTGNHYDPLLIELIKRCLIYFHEIAQNPKNHSIFYSKKIIEWHFYCNFLIMSNLYKLPLNVMLSFIKSININSQLNYKDHELIFQIQETIHKSDVIRQHCRGVSIEKYKEFYHIYGVIYNLIQNENQLIKINPIRLLKYLKHLNQLTQQELKILGYLKMAISTNYKVLAFIVKVYQKYFFQKYNNEVQKSNVQSWIVLSKSLQSQFLGQYITFLMLLDNYNKIQQHNKEFTRLINMCLQNYNQLSLHSKLIILQLSIKSGYKNIKWLIDSLDNKLNKETEKDSSITFKKVIQVQQYIKIFQFWPSINKISALILNQHKENGFLKLFWVYIYKFTNIEEIASLLSERIIVDHEFFSFFIKKYIRISQRNRTLTKSLYLWVKDPLFKQQLSKQPLIVNQNQDNKMSRFKTQKQQIRLKIKKCLSIFRFIIILLQKLRVKGGNLQVNITQSTLFKQLLFHFNEELKQLYYKELFTIEAYEIADEIAQYLQNKQVQRIDITVFEISKKFKRDININQSNVIPRICQKYYTNKDK